MALSSLHSTKGGLYFFKTGDKTWACIINLHTWPPRDVSAHTWPAHGVIRFIGRFFCDQFKWSFSEVQSKMEIGVHLSS
ncbi:hypothetical protein ACHQM5_017616 [Ranunculus cassubicifolius]